ncbi:Anti sigma-E protein RseA, N-terminal domain [Fontimonas thermophila]|uniref:Anti sigma-E protein RseA, N-terminal domain n=1 Tax=Fontimonas thermophila TaxID=1076937 RepID=A0A1I2JKS0_9GAMM|nr:sigma-E factor negative regulatory protein [Fontimonas thermophila]SFF55174.1 Anti sigma-E protein RseA, N-terminal domain [Fontimonas thermophila]
MTRDSLSALLDGECSPQELDRILEEMERSPELKLAWSRMCLVRDAREGVRVRRTQVCICADVMSRLEARPAPVTEKIVPIGRRRWRGYWKPLAGLAAAASIAGVALTFGLGERASDAVAESGFSPPQAGSAVFAPVSGYRPRYLQTVAAGGSEALRRAEIADELRAYLIEHSNTLADRGMGATLSYARFAAHSVGEPVAEPLPAELDGGQP